MGFLVTKYTSHHTHHCNLHAIQKKDILYSTMSQNTLTLTFRASVDCRFNELFCLRFECSAVLSSCAVCSRAAPSPIYFAKDVNKHFLASGFGFSLTFAIKNCTLHKNISAFNLTFAFNFTNKKTKFKLLKNSASFCSRTEQRVMHTPPIL